MVPIVLLTGFLGSGKTSLLNRLVAYRRENADSDQRMAIIVNEFGDIGIDGDLLPQEMTRQVELPGGCICCVLNEDLERTLHDLIDSEPDLQWIVIETTGIAEPISISWTLAGEDIGHRVRLAAVVTVVDSLCHLENRRLSPAVDGQVAYADLLVVSKLDLAGGKLPNPVLECLRELNPLAPILEYEPNSLAKALWEAISDPSLEREDALPSRPAQAHAHYDSVALRIKNILDFEELTSCLEELPANYVRIKGIAKVVDGSTGTSEPHWIAFHRVGSRVSREILDRASEPRIVGLGPGVVAADLAACVAASVVGS